MSMEQKVKSEDAEVFVQVLPLTGIVELESASDVPCDGGSKSLLQHDALSSLLNDHLDDFIAASKIQRPIVALEVLNEWRRKHQGRLVKLDEKRNLWNDVGDRKGRELIGKALRKLSEGKNATVPSSLSIINQSGKDRTGSAIEHHSTIQSVDTSMSSSSSQTKIIVSEAISSSIVSSSSDHHENTSFDIAVPGKDDSDMSRRISAAIRQNASQRCLYGRCQEQERLRQLYRESVSVNSYTIEENYESNGPKKPNFLILSGASGVGKTELALSLKPLVGDDKGTFIHVKFEQLAPEDSLGNLIKFLNGMARIVLDIKDLDLQRVHCKNIAQVITESLDDRIISVVPLLKEIMEKVSIDTIRQGQQHESLRKQSRKKAISQMVNTSFAEGALSIPQLRYSLVKIMKAVASADHPLVLFLDDIQYACSSAYDGITEELVLDQSGVFVVATFGMDDVDATHNQTISVTDFISGLNPDLYDVHYCHLGSLSSKTVHKLVAETMSLNPTELVNLSNVFFDLTNGNALFLLELLRHFQEDDLVSFDKATNQWVCDIHLIKQHPLLQVRTLRELFVAKISEMPDEAQETLKIASVIGSNFSRSVLAKLMGTEDVCSYCELAIQAGLLTRDSHHSYGFETDEDILAFRHDCIHRAVYDLIPDAKKNSFAFQLGMRLWRKVKDEGEMESFIFVILRLIIRDGENLLEKASDRVAIASLCLQAATKASKATGFDQSIVYLEFGILVLGQQKWRKHYDICLALFNSAIEAYYGTGDFEKVSQFVKEVMARARVFEDTFQARTMQVYTFGTTGRFAEAMDLGLETTSLLGESTCMQPSKLCILKKVLEIRRLVRKYDCQKLVQLPLMTDPQKNSVMLMYTFLFTPAYFRQPNLAVLICCRMIEMTIKFGASPVSSVGFAGIGAVLTRNGKNIEEAFSYGNIALGFSDRFGGEAWVCRVTSGVFGCINVWKVPIQKCLPPLKRAHLVGLGNGDIDVAILNASLYAWNSVDSLPITAIYSFIQSLNDRMSFLGHKQSALVPLKPFFHMCKNFVSQANGNPKNISDCMKSDMESSQDMKFLLTCASNVNFYSMILAYHFSDFKIAESLTRGASLLYHNLSSLGAAFGRMYHSLVLLERASSSKACKRHRIHVVRRNLKAMYKWSKSCPENFLGKQFLVEAELAAVLNKHPEAKTKYYMAIIQSRDSGLLWQEALANERAGKFYFKIGEKSEAINFFEEARRLYKTWGGIAKLEHFETEVEECFGELSEI